MSDAKQQENEDSAKTEAEVLTPEQAKRLEQRRKLEERAAAQAALAAQESSKTAKQLQDYSEDLALAELEAQEAAEALQAAQKKAADVQARLDGLRRVELDELAKKSDTEINQEYLRSEFQRRVDQAGRLGEVVTTLAAQGLMSKEAAKQLSLSPVDKAIAARIVNERKAQSRKAQGLKP